MRALPVVAGQSSFAFSGAGGVSLAGTLTRIVDVKLNSALDGFLKGPVSYVDARTGVTCQGNETGKLTNNFFERKLGVRATGRNWRTVTKLAELTK